MNGRIQRLRAEIASDRRAFLARVDEVSNIPLSRTATDAQLAQAAVALHHAYGAVESALARIAREIDGVAPEGADWHSALLESMALEIEDVRPAVVGASTVDLLRRLLGFRHFFRHAYAIALDGERLADLARKAVAVRPSLETEFDRFDHFLANLAKRVT